MLQRLSASSAVALLHRARRVQDVGVCALRCGHAWHSLSCCATATLNYLITLLQAAHRAVCLLPACRSEWALASCCRLSPLHRLFFFNVFSVVFASWVPLSLRGVFPGRSTWLSWCTLCCLERRQYTWTASCWPRSRRCAQAPTQGCSTESCFLFFSQGVFAPGSCAHSVSTPTPLPLRYCCSHQREVGQFQCPFQVGSHLVAVVIDGYVGDDVYST